ncbi:MAG: hypothetical protein NTY53_21765, partial [Kiritimatiellaeota bacterium]|nr:hypothetical protein [Kiritimatiellota bacterium]
GTHYLRAFVDANNATVEQSEGNNQSTLTYTVASAGSGTPAGKPDFTVTALTTTPATLTKGVSFSALITVKNQGTAGDAGKLRLWLNHGATAAVGEAGDAEQSVGSLAAGASTNLVISGLTAPNAAGTYYIRTFVDADNSTVEQSEGNNQKTKTYGFY